jgi:hypothetical protein
MPEIMRFHHPPEPGYTSCRWELSLPPGNATAADVVEALRAAEYDHVPMERAQFQVSFFSVPTVQLHWTEPD